MTTNHAVFALKVEAKRDNYVWANFPKTPSQARLARRQGMSSRHNPEPP